MDIKRLQYFVTAAEEGNLHRAAERLHVVQPALSKQIAALESELGCQLFARIRGRLHLTPAGQQYLADARQILLSVQQAGERARRVAAGHSGLLRIGFRETAGRSKVVSGSFSEFRASYPDVELQLNQLTSPLQCEALRKRELDLGFIYLSADHDYGLAHLSIAEDSFWLALPHNHPLCAQPEIHLRELDNEPFIWLARHRQFYYADRLMANALRGGLTPRIIQEADSETTALNLVAVGMGLSFVVAPAGVTAHENVVLKPVVELPERLRLALAWNPDDVTAATANFVEIVRANLARQESGQKLR